VHPRRRAGDVAASACSISGVPDAEICLLLMPIRRHHRGRRRRGDDDSCCADSRDAGTEHIAQAERIVPIDRRPKLAKRLWPLLRAGIFRNNKNTPGAPTRRILPMTRIVRVSTIVTSSRAVGGEGKVPSEKGQDPKGGCRQLPTQGWVQRMPCRADPP